MAFTDLVLLSYVVLCVYAWRIPQFTDLVVFGDSWSDAGRLQYIIAHNGSMPPVGWTFSEDSAAADGGRPWPSYVGQYTGARVHNYAVSGGVCSHAITPEIFKITHELFPDINTYGIPAFFADSQYTLPNGTKFMHISPESTVFAIMIGGNDVGAYAFLTDSQVPGKTIPDYVDCVFEQIDRLYQHGARYFLLNQLGAMYLAPQYAMPATGGLKATQYWPDKYSNTTAASQRMLEQVALVNAIYELRTPLEVEYQRRYPGAQFALVKLEALMDDIYHNPSDYFNGTAPFNVTGYLNHCTLEGTDCVRIDNNNPDAFMWFDELHPSEQTWRMIAKNFVEIIKGRSKWAQYYSG